MRTTLNEVHRCDIQIPDQLPNASSPEWDSIKTIEEHYEDMCETDHDLRSKFTEAGKSIVHLIHMVLQIAAPCDDLNKKLSDVGEALRDALRCEMKTQSESSEFLCQRFGVLWKTFVEIVNRVSKWNIYHPEFSRFCAPQSIQTNR